MITSTTTHPGVTAFAAAVRDALSDLPRQEVDELTEGLEADLADRAAEVGPELGDPAAYAEELRFAAGLPARGGSPRVGYWSGLVERARRLLAHPRIAGFADFAVSLRPAWWLLRAWLAYFLATGVFGQLQVLPLGVLPFVTLVVALVVSVQIGRGKLLAQRALRGLIVAANVFAVLVLPFALDRAWAGQMRIIAFENTTYHPQGLTRDGSPVSNIFAYGPDGQLLTGVQLFDQDGKPLDLVGDTSAEYSSINSNGRTILVPSSDVPGRAGWNVVPLEEVPSSARDDSGGLRSTVTPRAVTPPFASVQPLVGPH